jgi:hypothetical protein
VDSENGDWLVPRVGSVGVAALNERMRWRAGVVGRCALSRHRLRKLPLSWPLLVLAANDSID